MNNIFNHKSWPKKRLGEFVNLEYGKNLPKDAREYGKFPVYGSNGVVGCHKDPLVKAPGIIVGRKGSIGKILLSELDFWPIDTTYFIRNSTEYDLKWLYYLLQALNLESMNRATGVPGLNRDDVYNLTVSVPSISEQRKIVEILSSTDEATEKTDQIIQKSEELKNGLMNDLFLDNKPLNEWPLGEVTNFIDYRGKTPKKTETGIPLITAKNVRMGFVDREPREYIATDNYESWMTRGIPKLGDVLFTTEAPLGNVAQLDIDGKVAFAQRVIIIQPKPVINPTFLKYLLMSKKIQEKVGSLGTGGTVKGIKAKVLKQIQISIPCMDEQTKVVDVLQTLDMKIDNEKKTKIKLQIEKNGIMQNIFNQKIIL